MGGVAATTVDCRGVVLVKSSKEASWVCGSRGSGQSSKANGDWIEGLRFVRATFPVTRSHGSVTCTFVVEATKGARVNSGIEVLRTPTFATISSVGVRGGVTKCGSGQSSKANGLVVSSSRPIEAKALALLLPHVSVALLCPLSSVSQSMPEVGLL